MSSASASNPRRPTQLIFLLKDALLSKLMYAKLNVNSISKEVIYVAQNMAKYLSYCWEKIFRQ